jgi:thiosulfate reductase/polysulfide reductase chain A
MMERKRLMKKISYSICGMCTVRCPIRVESDGEKVTWMEGNPTLLGGALCARGLAGMALREDDQRPQTPLIRVGARGQGRWREASWEEALKYVADKLDVIRRDYGPEAVTLSSRGGPWQALYKSFIHAFGSPNYTNHDAVCGRNTHHASLSLYGVGRTDFVYDIENAKHLVLFGRDMFSALRIAENIKTIDMLEKGGRLTYVDVRQTRTGIKGTRFFQVRPGTDYALALSIIHGVIKKGYYDHEFIEKYTSGFEELSAFIEQYTPAWAAKACDVKEKDINAFIEEIGEDRPNVIFHPGWNLARYSDSFYASRALHILNVLMGNIEKKGGLLFSKGAGDCGVKGIRSIDISKPDIKRADGVGWKYPQFDKGPGILHLLYDAVRSGEPYPVKGWIAMRHDPLSCMPDPEAQKRLLDKLDLLVSIDTNYSEFGWYSDVILPESTYLERDNFIVQQKGLKPRLARREQVLPPKYDTRASWEIFRDLARLLDMKDFIPFDTIEEFWQWQLEPTGHTLDEFDEKGFIDLVDEPVLLDPDKLDGKFTTPSGKIEFVSKKLTDCNLPSLKPYEAPASPSEGTFRLIYGKTPLHTQGHTINNPLLIEQMPVNCLWINSKVARKLNISEGDIVDVFSADENYNASLPARITDFIHPEAVYMTHGFGKDIPRQKRSLHSGASDQKLMSNGLTRWDKAGGCLSLCENFIRIEKSMRNNIKKIAI